MVCNFLKCCKVLVGITSILIFVALIPSSCIHAEAEVPQIEWEKTFGSVRGNSLAQAADDGLVVAAQSGIYTNMGYTNGQTVLIKTDSFGNIEWNKTIGDYPNSQALINTKDGGFAVIQTNSNPEGANNAEPKITSCLIKTDSEGNVQWSRVFQEPTSVYIKSITEDSEGGYVLAGYTQSSFEYSDKALVIKIDSTGHLEWERKYENGSRIVSIVETAGGGYVIGGGFDGKLWLGKLDQVGTLQWAKRYDEYGSANFLIKTRDSGYSLGGASGSVVRTDSEGNVQWSRIYENGKEGTRFDCAVETAEGGYLFAGASVFTVSRGWLVKTVPGGDVEWNSTYSGLGESSVSSLQQTRDGGYVFTGQTSLAHDYTTYIWLVKTGPLSNSEDANSSKLNKPLPTIWIAAITVMVILFVVSLGALIYNKRKAMGKK